MRRRTVRRNRSRNREGVALIFNPLLLCKNGDGLKMETRPGDELRGKWLMRIIADDVKLEDEYLCFLFSFLAAPHSVERTVLLIKGVECVLCED